MAIISLTPKLSDPGALHPDGGVNITRFFVMGCLWTDARQGDAQRDKRPPRHFSQSAELPAPTGGLPISVRVSTPADHDALIRSFEQAPLSGAMLSLALKAGSRPDCGAEATGAAHVYQNEGIGLG